ncbi:MAG TPA: disulfide bond formation protein B [Promineifilum sp.]|nr:disulfide bond formation protein B [Promineifilum sp.]
MKSNESRLWPPLFVAWLIALLATAGALFLGEVMGMVPCVLCWYQRILMYPLAVVTLVGALKHDEYLPTYVLPLSITGILVSGYHVLLEKGVFPPSTTCAADVPCNISYVNYFGFITIAVMALTAFVLITAIMIATRSAYRRDVSGQLPLPTSEDFSS